MPIDGGSVSSDAADERTGTGSAPLPPPLIEHKAYARVGLLGNPSDVYFGRTISFSLANFWASVRLQPSDDLVIQPHPLHDLVRFHSIHHLVRTSPSLSFNLFFSFLFIRFRSRVRLGEGKRQRIPPRACRIQYCDLDRRWRATVRIKGLPMDGCDLLSLLIFLGHLASVVW